MSKLKKVNGVIDYFQEIKKNKQKESVTDYLLDLVTDKVYLNREWTWGYRENEELCGFDPYSNSKSCSELVTYSYKNSFFAEKSCSFKELTF